MSKKTGGVGDDLAGLWNIGKALLQGDATIAEVMTEQVKVNKTNDEVICDRQLAQGLCGRTAGCYMKHGHQGDCVGTNLRPLPQRIESERTIDAEFTVVEEDGSGSQSDGA